MGRIKTELWERRKGERPTAYDRFIAFRDLGRDRTLQAAAEKGSVTHGYLRQLSAQYDWTNRVAAWDTRLVAAQDEVILSEVERVTKEQLKTWSVARLLGATALVRAFKHAQTHDAMPIDVRDALALVKEATAAERLIMGEATSRDGRVELTDIDKMSTERAELLLELLREAGGI